MRNIIYGAGSLGTVLGAFLEKNSEEITLVSRNVEHVKMLNEKGAKVVGNIEMCEKVHAVLPSEMEGKYDIIFLMTKQQDNADAAAFLKDFMHEDSLVVALQNGIPEPYLKEKLGENRVVGGIVEWGARLVAPGVSELTSDISANIIKLEKNEKVEPERLDKVKSILEKMCEVTLEENMTGARWSKLLINATFTGIGTSVNGTFGDVAKGKKTREIAVRSVKECIDICRTAGVTILPVQGNNIEKLFYYRSPVKKMIAKLIIPVAMKKHYKTEPSMLQDLKKGKKCEIDQINGVVVQWGKKYGVDTPVNSRIVEIVKKEERGELPLSSSNIELFNDLI
ncbi:MAG: 2-dehydropantoate 2-reductase [Clostridia bacterium]|nr:2-dehydropantoate 2-reductase [Clostridia bacterium]